MVEKFEKDEERYRAWIRENPAGFVVNVDVPNSKPDYPMVHCASHKIVSSERRGNYTTGRYVKFCSTSLEDLEERLQGDLGRPPTRCAVCM